MEQKLIYIVYSFADVIDSVWDNQPDADNRLDELDKENGKWSGVIHEYVLNQPEGFHV